MASKTAKTTVRRSPTATSWTQTETVGATLATRTRIMTASSTLGTTVRWLTTLTKKISTVITFVFSSDFVIFLYLLIPVCQGMCLIIY